MAPPARSVALAALVLLSAGWMLVDGARALLLGDYFRVEGQLGPWAALVAAVGIDPLAIGMRLFFVVYGALWLGAGALHAAGRARDGVLVAFALGSLWYLVVGTVLALAQVALLQAKARRRPRTA